MTPLPQCPCCGIQTQQSETRTVQINTALAADLSVGEGIAEFLVNAAVVPLRPDAVRGDMLPDMKALLDRYDMHVEAAQHWRAACMDPFVSEAKGEYACTRWNGHLDDMKAVRLLVLRKLELTFGAGMGEGIAKVFADA